jgi:demethylmenaquinone methyltransferase/2-methoxy-6-polyprenyl-1,4-benzoquinol methylase
LVGQFQSAVIVEKSYVRSLFDGIASRYDLLNHLLSGGFDLYWRRVAVHSLAQYRPSRILDVATGTADLAIAAARLNPGEIVAIDFSEEMLARGRKKVLERNLDSMISLRTGDAENLEFGGDTFDAAMVAFGVRNFEHLERGLAEMFRVIRHGGRIVVLEFSRPRIFPLNVLYKLYFLYLLPLVGRFISGHPEAYQYLPDTVMQFPDGDAFLARLHDAGFHEANARRLTFGIASLYTARKP